MSRDEFEHFAVLSTEMYYDASQLSRNYYFVVKIYIIIVTVVFRIVLKFVIQHSYVILFRAQDVLIKVQGPRPENILFLVNEVIETLICESFHGVRYDYQVPCTDCLKAVSSA